MDVELILKVAGVGLIITLVCQLLSKAGRDEQSTLISLLGMALVFILIAEKVGELINTLRGAFGR